MKYLLTILLFCISLILSAQKDWNYHSLDHDHPIHFGESLIVYANDTIHLGPRSFFIDGQLSKTEANRFPFVYSSLQDAVKDLKHGTESEPMTLHIAPYVYWVDDPDDPEIRIPAENYHSPYGMIIKCEWLRFHGLNPNPENVVLASNRGQTIGAKGNFTMFRFEGDGTSAENITFGNYCNVDLIYPLKPELSRSKRASAIVQAQLIHCNGDKIFARNTHFISRLNLCPFVGSKRALFDKCHFESTDDALNGSAVYLNSTFEFYSPKPFYHTTGTGAVFLNCDINSVSNVQYFTKANGQLALVDTRITGKQDLEINWRDNPPATARNYQYHVTLNGNPILIGDSTHTVDMEGLPLLDAYWFQFGDQVVYNTYNLLRGNDDWDPMGIKGLVLKAEKKLGRNLTDIPIQLRLLIEKNELETKKDTAKLNYRTYRFGNYESDKGSVKINYLENGGDYLSLMIAPDQSQPLFIPNNQGMEQKEVIVEATTASGLETAHHFYVRPEILPAPSMLKPPTLSIHKEGHVKINYTLASAYSDQSKITWYRCTDKKGNKSIEVATTKLNKPLRNYQLTSGDEGYFIKAVIQPKHIRSELGKSFEIIYKKSIKPKDILSESNLINPDFSILSTKNQINSIPGFWTFRHIENPDRPVTGDAWWYGTAKYGAEDSWGLTQGRSGFMSFTPVDAKKENMSLHLKIVPSKTAGQGFSVAPLYMDVLIKFDTKTMTGYGLRLIRTTKYGRAIDCYFVKYENGTAAPISDAISTSCYRPDFTLDLTFKNTLILAKGSTTASYNKEDYTEEVLPEIDISTPAEANDFGGFGIYYNGGASMVITDLKANWE